MSFKWADFLNTAEGLLKYPDKEYNEARWRSSISRAYYACHCTASTLLKSEGSNLDKKSFSGDFVGIHNKVIEIFKDSGEKKDSK